MRMYGGTAVKAMWNNWGRGFGCDSNLTSSLPLITWRNRNFSTWVLLFLQNFSSKAYILWCLQEKQLSRTENGYFLLFMDVTISGSGGKLYQQAETNKYCDRNGTRGDVTLFHEETHRPTVPRLTYLGNKVTNHLEIATMKSNLPDCSTVQYILSWRSENTLKWKWGGGGHITFIPDQLFSQPRVKET
jgi:hypothetical protein